MKNASRDTIKFGDAVVTVRKPSSAELRQNVAFSSEALARANTQFARAGVRIYPKKDVPLFFADPEHPGSFLRKLNGTLQRGVVKDGQFKAID
ncbi:MAG TPA: hypothetical protein VH023_16195 [Rhodopila sp.]|jgi:hypothetical protein|nr:hypothetical protein [Rhodopila sp.]